RELELAGCHTPVCTPLSVTSAAQSEKRAQARWMSHPCLYTFVCDLRRSIREASSSSLDVTALSVHPCMSPLPQKRARARFMSHPCLYILVCHLYHRRELE
ncbi:hypothetical protein NDU88_001543, partial [Pleurodeles waltl]